MARRLSSPVLVGREGELAELVAVLAEACEGLPRIVLVDGEAGIGKSRLLAELRTLAVERGVRVLQGQCAGLEGAAIPLLPVTDALRDLADDDARQDGRRASAAPVRETGRLPGSVSHGRVFAHVMDRIGRAAASTGLLLLIEDIHWADCSTLDLLTFIARRLRRERLLIIATYRDDDVDRHADLRHFLAEIATSPRVQRLPLAGLPAPAMHELIAQILGVAPPADVVDSVGTRSEGNPFFAEELVATAISGMPNGLSANLRDMLLARISTLDADAKAVVGVAAAGGRQAHYRLLAAASALPQPQLDQALQAAVTQGVLVADGEGFSFRHALLQEAVYNTLLPGQRSRLHAAFATALETRPDLAGGNAATRAAEVAHHWHHADDPPRALAASVLAGTSAAEAGASAEAAGHHTRALALWDAVPDAEHVAGIDHATLLLHAANATAATGRPAEAVPLIDAAIALIDPATDPLRVALLYERRAYLLWETGRGADGLPDLERAIALIPPEPPTAEYAGVLATLGFVLCLDGQHARARACCETALAAARSVGARGAETYALCGLAQSVYALGDHAAGLELAREARSIAVSATDDKSAATTAIALSFLLLYEGRLTESVEVALAGAREARRAGDSADEGFCLVNAAKAAFEQGRWDLADRLGRDVLALDLTGVPRAANDQQVGMLACARGDLDGGERHLVAARVAVPEPSAQGESYRLELEAEIALWRRRPETAARAASQDLEPSSERTYRYLVMASLGLRAEADQAELARARRDGPAALAACERATALYTAGRERARGAGHAPLTALLEAEHARAMGANLPGAWDLAAREWEGHSSPYRAAYARWRQAEAALAVRDRPQAVRAIHASYATARDLGAENLQTEIEALARRARIELTADLREPNGGVPAPDTTATDDLGLTIREREILEHLALGQTNHAIAGELYISVKTVSIHVSHILGKLGAANRGEAAAIAHRLHLVP